MSSNQNEGLKRELGVMDVAINVINISVASGIFLLPAIIAGILGNASIIAYILCGLMFLLIALCYAEVSSRITTSGGAYAYIEKAFGPCAGFVANALFWFGTGVLVAAALVNGIADMLSVHFPVFTNLMYRGILFLVLFAFIALMNIIGGKKGLMAMKFITFIKVLPLILMVVVGLFHLNTSNLRWQGFPAIDQLGAASIILFFAFAGGETALNISGEMKNPNRTAPLGLLLGIVVVVAFYSLIQLVAQSTLGPSLTNQKAPLAAVAGVLAGSWGTRVLITCGVIAIFGSLYSLVLVFSRVLYAGAKDGLLPVGLSKLHPRFSTPHIAIITLSSMAFCLAVTGGFRQLLVLATISLLLLYTGVALALIKFISAGSKEYPPAFKLPGGIAIPVTTLIILTCFISQSKAEELIATGIFLALLLMVYAVRSQVQKKKSAIRSRKNILVNP
jgi:amino acid transporter